MDADETRRALAGHGLDRPRGMGFAVRDPERGAVYDWHVHAYHQLIYAIAGPSRIETEQGRHTLPQGRAAWISAGTPHRSLVAGTDGASLFFSPEAIADTVGRVRILTASPVMREMMLFAMRWPLGTGETSPLAASFFQTLARLCVEGFDGELPLFLPAATHPALRRAMDGAEADLRAASQGGAAAAAAMSDRTFRRLFAREMGMGWQAWLRQARVVRAMELLAEGRQVTAAAVEVGYESLSAFAKSFAQVAGEPPARFRKRHVQARKPGSPARPR